MMSLLVRFAPHSVCTPQFCFATMAVDRFASLSDKELQALLEDRNSSNTKNVNS
jgi:hypothetical protein